MNPKDWKSYLDEGIGTISQLIDEGSKQVSDV